MTATAVYSTDLKLSAYPQFDETKYPDIYGDVQTVHAAIRYLQQYLDSYTGSKFTGRATGTINVGQIVAVATGYSDLTGVTLANATNHLLPAIGFATSSASAGQGIDVQTWGIYPYGNGTLVPGTKYYLNTTSGQITSGPPVTAGNTVQFLGIAIDTSNLLFRPSQKYLEL